jgi:hypothetical protein
LLAAKLGLENDEAVTDGAARVRDLRAGAADGEPATGFVAGDGIATARNGLAFGYERGSERREGTARARNWRDAGCGVNGEETIG